MTIRGDDGIFPVRSNARQSGSVLVLTLTRPEKRNALSLEVMRELIAALEVRDGTDAVVVLRALGPVFSAGHDLREMLRPRRRRVPRDLRRLRAHDEEDPAHSAAGHRGGRRDRDRRGLPVRRDLRSGDRGDGREVRDAGRKIGLFCTTPMVALTRAIGRKRAMEMLLTGEFVDAQTAADWGLINRAVAARPAARRSRWRSRERSPRRAISSSVSARRRFTRRSISISRKRTRTPRKS